MQKEIEKYLQNIPLFRARLIASGKRGYQVNIFLISSLKHVMVLIISLETLLMKVHNIFFFFFFLWRNQKNTNTCTFQLKKKNQNTLSVAMPAVCFMSSCTQSWFLTQNFMITTHRTYCFRLYEAQVGDNVELQVRMMHMNRLAPMETKT